LATESVPSYTLDVAGIATSGETPTYASRSVVSVRPGTTVAVSFMDFASGNPDRFYIDILSKSSAIGDRGSISSSRFVLDNNFPFDVVFPSRFIRMSADAVRDLISYDPTKNVLSANLAAIYSRGFFDFDIVLRMAAEGTVPFTKTDIMPLLKVQALPAAESFFSKLSVRVEKPENPDLHRIVVSEDERIDPVTLCELETGNAAGCDDRPYSLVANGSVIRSAAGVQSYTGLDIDASYNVPANFPLWNIDDRATDSVFRSSIAYPGSNPKFATQIRHIQYNLENSLYFYDQVITRRLQSARGYTGNHPILHMQDLFGSCVAHEDGAPMLQFRREYTKNENTSNDQKFRSDINYMLYLDPLHIRSSNLSVNVFSVRLRRGSPRDMKCILKWTVDGKRLLKNKEEIHIEATVEWGADGGAKKKRHRILRIRRSVSDGHPWCRNTTYGSGDVDAEAGYPMRLLTVQDMLHILQRNISGTVGGSTPFGDSSGGGLFPTFAELGINNTANPELPVVEWVINPNYYGCYLLPAHRLTFGSRLMSPGGEVAEISFDYRSADIMCKGLERDVSFDKLGCIMPLNRKVGEAGVRSSIKSFYDHVNDGDFNPDGRADNRFYKDWTLASAARVFREGRDYFTVRNRRQAAEVDLAYGSSPPRSSRAAGTPCRLIGAAHIGVSVAFLELDPEGAGSFGEESPSYVLSGISTALPLDAHRSDVVPKVDSLGTDGVCLMYIDRPMFGSPHTALSPGSPRTGLPGSEYPHGKSGSIWSVVYTTGSGSGIKSEEKHLTAGHTLGSSDLLDPMLHGPKYKTMSEGGEEGSSSRAVHINPCFDFSGKLKPDSKLALEDLLDFGRASGRAAGNYAKVSMSNPAQHGLCPVGGKGRKRLNMSYEARRSASGTEVKLTLDNSSQQVLGGTFADFEDSLWKNIGSIARLMTSSSIRRSDPMPWLEIDFSKYSTGLPADLIDDPYLEQGDDPYVSFVDPYGEIAYRPSGGIMREYGFRNINPRVGLRFKWLKKIIEPRSFSFFLRDRRFNSLADLHAEMNRRLGRLGIRTSVEVKNPELRDQRNIVASERVNILRVVDPAAVSFLQDPYFGPSVPNLRPSADDPYSIGDPYATVSPQPGSAIRSHAVLSGSVEMADVSPSTSALVVVHMRPFEGRRSPLYVQKTASSRLILQDPAGKVTPPTGWYWSQDQIGGMVGRVLRRDPATQEGVPLLPDLPGGMTWKQLNKDVWYPSAGGNVPMPTDRPRDRKDD
jgi:hypothetical protein